MNDRVYHYDNDHSQVIEIDDNVLVDLQMMNCADDDNDDDDAYKTDTGQNDYLDHDDIDVQMNVIETDQYEMFYFK